MKDLESLSYEEAFAELETVVNALESEEQSLDDSLTLFERGQALIKRCAFLLEKASLKIRQLSSDGLDDEQSA